jgi:DMSO/TMAO reductase YedYZ molybdopterin-dependent catalytic subunit
MNSEVAEVSGKYSKFPYRILSAEEIPELKLSEWDFRITGSSHAIRLTAEIFLEFPVHSVPVQFLCDSSDKFEYIWAGVDLAEVIEAKFFEDAPDDAVGFEVRGRDGFISFLPLSCVLVQKTYFAFQKNGSAISHKNGGPVRIIWKDITGKRSIKWPASMELVSHSMYDG